MRPVLMCALWLNVWYSTQMTSCFGVLRAKLKSNAWFMSWLCCHCCPWQRLSKNGSEHLLLRVNARKSGVEDSCIHSSHSCNLLTCEELPRLSDVVPNVDVWRKIVQIQEKWCASALQKCSCPLNHIASQPLKQFIYVLHLLFLGEK